MTLKELLIGYGASSAQADENILSALYKSHLDLLMALEQALEASDMDAQHDENLYRKLISEGKKFHEGKII